MTTLFIKIPSRAKAPALLRVAGLGELVVVKSDGTDAVNPATHDFSAHYIDNLVTRFPDVLPDGTVIDPGVTAGPHLMISFNNPEAFARLGSKLEAILPPGLEKRLAQTPHDFAGPR